MPVFIPVGKLVLLKGIKSAIVMSFPAQTINKIPLKVQMKWFFIAGFERAAKIRKIAVYLS